MNKVYVYFNLHKKIFSVRKNGKVIRHCKKIIVNNALFKVSQSGRERVIVEKRKNVHAFVVGRVFSGTLDPKRYNLTPVYYNPYKYSSFIRLENKTPIFKADYVCLVVKDKKPVIMALEEIK